MMLANPLGPSEVGANVIRRSKSDWSPTNSENELLRQINNEWMANRKKQLKEAAAKDGAWTTEKEKEKMRKTL